MKTSKARKLILLSLFLFLTSVLVLHYSAAPAATNTGKSKQGLRPATLRLAETRPVEGGGKPPRSVEARALSAVKELPEWLRGNLALRGRFVDSKFGTIKTELVVQAGLATEDTCAYLNDIISAAHRTAAQGGFSQVQLSGATIPGDPTVQSFLMHPNAAEMEVLRKELAESLSRVIPASDAEAWLNSIFSASAFAVFRYPYSAHLITGKDGQQVVTIGGTMPAQLREGGGFDFIKGTVDGSPYFDNKKLVMAQKDDAVLFEARWGFLRR